MSRSIVYRIVTGLLLLLAGICLPGCSGDKKAAKEKPDWSVTLDHESRTPYGTSIVYETLPAYFPGARREPLTRWLRYTSIDEHMTGSPDSASLIVMLGLDFFVTQNEWLHLLKFVKSGNEIFILAANIDRSIGRSLHIQREWVGGEQVPLSRYNDGSEAVRALRLRPDTSAAYGYVGRSINSFFKLGKIWDDDTLRTAEEEDETLAGERHLLAEAIDTNAQILGVTAGRPDFVRFRVGRGHITLHAAPLVFSNYFLLQPGNRAYLDGIWHSFPDNISAVYWNEYFSRSTERSSLAVLLKYPAMRWAIIIAALTLLLYVLFGLKRIQRIVPEIPPVENASVSFVETVGRLYFNKGAHANLAEKMTQHFLEWVRTYYYLDTSQLNEAFVKSLAAKSGKPEGEAAALVGRIHNIRLGAPVTPEALLYLYRSIQSFYKTR